ncbi:MAG: hypothetical protein ACE5L6_04390 [Candidatus Bathyarchaeia archaeon]
MGIYRFRTWILFKGLSEKRISGLLPHEPKNLANKLKKAEDPDRFLSPYIEAVKEHFPAITGRYTAYTSNRGSQVFRVNVDYRKPGLMTVVYSRLARKSGVPFKLESFVTLRRFDEKTAEDFDLPDSVLVKE